jgi:hypothetical protein
MGWVKVTYLLSVVLWSILSPYHYGVSVIHLREFIGDEEPG